MKFGKKQRKCGTGDSKQPTTQQNLYSNKCGRSLRAAYWAVPLADGASSFGPPSGTTGSTMSPSFCSASPSFSPKFNHD